MADLETNPDSIYHERALLPTWNPSEREKREGRFESTLPLNWGHSGNFSRYQTQVPLLIRWPGEAPLTFTHRTGHVDLAPTLMRDLLGCTTDSAAYSTGRHLLDTAERDFLVIGAYNRFSVVEENRITVYYYAGLVETYDPGYRELTGDAPDPQLALKAIERIGRFYAR